MVSPSGLADPFPKRSVVPLSDCIMFRTMVVSLLSSGLPFTISRAENLDLRYPSSRSSCAMSLLTRGKDVLPSRP